jgi:c-di-GMP-binding flagellar brake protein YcgR
MNHLVERRRYQRCSNLICKVFVSVDETKWDLVELLDISAGGLKFSYSDAINSSSKMFFQLYVYNMLSEFNLRAEAEVIRYEKCHTDNVYAVRFRNMPKYEQIQLDELAKSKICITNGKTSESGLNESPVFINARNRAKKIKIYF